MGAVLARDVHVTKDGVNFVVLQAGKAVPKEYSKLVTNPKAFVEVEGEPVIEPAAAVDPASLPYDKRKVEDLRDLLKSHELPTDGKKDELVARLVQFDQENAEEPAAGDEAGSGDDETEEE